MNKILLVSGASSDVGACLIKTVADHYDRIVCHYRNSTSVIEGLQSSLGEKIVPVYADFSDEASTVKFTETVLERGLAPQHFVHLASSSASSVNVKFNKTDWKLFESEIGITFRSAILLSRAFVPLMAKEKYGKVVYMLSSQMVWKPAKPYSTAYTCVKYALFGAMESLAAEYASKGVTVNAVSPSMIDTKFLKIPDLVKQANLERSPLKRLLTPEDVVPTFAFLLSPGADTITGQNIPVMGGN